MQLIISKSQSKGMLGGISFEVRAQVRLTAQEQQLIQQYRLEDAIFLQKRAVIWGQPTDQMIDIRVRHFLGGEAFRCKDLSEVITYCESLKSAGETLKTYLVAASTFGGQEVYDF